MKKLKPGTSYDFSEADLRFVIELAKVGHVHLLSKQVSLTKESGYDESASINFTDIINKEKCDGLQLPSNWVIEWIGCSKKGVCVTFGVKKVVTILLLTFFFSCSPRITPCPKDVSGDTVPSKILISAEPPAFGHSIDGYCVYRKDSCTGRHLKFWHKRWIVIGLEYTVWACKRRVQP